MLSNTAPLSASLSAHGLGEAQETGREMPSLTEAEIRALEAAGIEVLDPRASHRQLRCRVCGATWRPRRRTDGRLDDAQLRCWRGCRPETEPEKV
jgi:hypothetical protein